MDATTDWLMSGPPWARHGTLVDLLGRRPDDQEVIGVRRAILEDSQIRGVLQATAGRAATNWPGCCATPPQLLCALLRFGLGEDPRVGMAVRHLEGLVEENGWQCVVSPGLGKFRGPGRKADPCPCATLLSLKSALAIRRGARQ